MYKIGLIGNTPEYIQNVSETKTIIKNTLDIIRFQYKDDLVLNIMGDTGVSEWATDVCLEFDIKYHLFLPFPPTEMEFLWYSDQYQKLLSHFESAWATTITAPRFDPSNVIQVKTETAQHVVNHSQFVICLWNKMKQGLIFDSMRYALSKNILLIDAADEMKMVTNEYLVK